MGPVYNKFKVAEGDEELFSLKGKKEAEKRMKIYKFLLSHLSDQHRFHLQGKLCQARTQHECGWLYSCDHPLYWYDVLLPICMVSPHQFAKVSPYQI